MLDFTQEAQELFSYSQNLRRDFHRHPELGFQEVRTAGIVARELSALGLEVTPGVAKTGVVALLEGAQPGPVVLVRFDMDALPIIEDTGAEYASTQPGVMHACGHDGHVAIGLTVAKLLHQHRDALKGTVKFMFQPAEEGLGGATGMMAAGVLENPKPDLALALHVWNEQPVGWVGIAPGPVMAGSGIFKIKITGKGGHAAAPHTTIDPLLAGAQIVGALQSIVARNISPLKTAVVSVTMFHAGDAFNVIPQVAEIAGTVRGFDPAVQEQANRRIEEIARGVAAAMGCAVEMDVRTTTPPVVNDAGIAAKVVESARQRYPNLAFSEQYQTMGSEDMAFVMQEIPGCYFFVGSSNEARGLNYGHHHPKFDIDEAVLPQAAALMAGAVADLLA